MLNKDLTHRAGLRSAIFASLVLAAIWSASASNAQAPAGYYDSVDTTNAITLRLTLHDVIDDHTRFPYTASTTDTWDIINLADEDPNNIGNIIDIYKNASYPKIAGGVGAYNREHSWPKSYGFPDDALGNYPYTDTHHLFASDASYNGARSNLPFRDCNSGCTEQTTDFNDGRGGGSGIYPGNSNWHSGSFTEGTWETWNGRKGDVARAVFYMDLRYEGGVHGGTGFAEPDLIVTDSETLIDSGNTGSNESVAYMGMLSVLLQWHAQDPPDSREIWRNEVVYSFQGNRNPFIDHPEWIGCLFNDVCTTDTTPPAAPTGLLAIAGNGLVDLSWLANSESDLAGYNVYRATVAGGPYSKVNSSQVNSNGYVDASVTNGTTYFYVVTAVDTSSNESPDSQQVSSTPDGSIPDTTPPDPPMGLAAAAGDTQVQLTWNANGESDLAGYNVYRATGAGGPYSQANGALVTTPSYVDAGLTNGTATFYVITAVDTSSNESANSDEATATPQAAGTGGLLLSEVLYDVSSTDDGFEWIELFNSGTGPIDLAQYCLANGGTSYSFSQAQLAGTVASGATFVVGGPTSSTTNAQPAFDQVFNFNPDFQNSGSTADGVALFDVPCAQVDSATVPVDAVIYGGSNGNGLIDETGAANAPEVGDASAGSSLERIDLAGNWLIQSNPTPNSTLLSPPGGNQAPTVTIGSPADGASFAEGTSINFSATASDAEDGNLTSSLTWTSSLDGALGSGGAFSTVLSVGSHTITATVTDSGSLQSSDAVAVTINPNTPPSVTISTPSNGAHFAAGASISFAGSATDAEDGALTAGLSWTSNLDGALGGGGSFSAELSVGSHTITATVTDSGSLVGSSAVSVTVDPATPSSGALLLSEVFYDPSGNDDGLEWVELFNNDSVAIDLASFSLGNGGTGYTTSLVQLSGIIQPGQTFVIGGPTANATNGNPSLDLAINFNPDFQNSGSAGDGVALFNVAATAVTNATVPIDAVIYGPNNNNGLIDENGLVSAPEVADAPSGSSIERLDIAGAWQVQATPTPGATPLGAPVNTAPSVAISAPLDGSSFDDGQAITFTGAANDTEDGNLSASLAWTSDLDGPIGSGNSFSTSLSVGSHTLTAAVTDSGGLNGSAAVQVTIDPVIGPTTVTFTAIAAEDGWVRESSESSNVGGRFNATNTGTSALRAGDHRNDRQYKGILSFDTSALPDGATIVSATLRLRRGRVTGTNPFATHGTCWVDVHSGGLGGSTALANSDFEAVASVAKTTSLSEANSNGDWSEGSFDPTGLGAVDKAGTTQLRVYFDLDDNDDGGTDYIGYYSANHSTSANHPQLVVTYQ